RELFAMERERDAAWIAEASAPGPAPTNTMHPPPAATHPPPAESTTPAIPVAMLEPARMPGDLAVGAHDWPRGAPPDGMFSPAPPRPADAARVGDTGPPAPAVNAATQAATVFAQPPPRMVPVPQPAKASVPPPVRASAPPPAPVTSAVAAKVPSAGASAP